MSHRHRLAAGATVLLVSALSLSVFQWIWRRSALEELPSQPGGWIGAAIIVALSAVAHEALHALGWRIAAGSQWKPRSISIAPTWRKMGLAVRMNAPLSDSRYAFGLLLPAFTLGLGTMVCAIAAGRGLVLLWSLFFLLECYADLTAFFASPRRD